jgi:hypothetical protein
MYKNPLITKGLALAIVVLFVGTCIVPLVSSISMEKDIIDIKTCSYGSQDNDTTLPYTTISLNGTMGENGWYISDVMVTLNATDNDSGVNVTYYRMDNYLWEYNGPFLIQYSRIIDFYSVDNAGNREIPKEIIIGIDNVPPNGMLGIMPIRCDVKLSVICQDVFSRVDRVDFYVGPTLVFSDNESPYEYIWPNAEGQYYNAIIYDEAGNKEYAAQRLGSEHIIGLIRDRKVTEDYISCYAIALWSSSDGFHMSEQLTFPKTLSGYVGRFFMCASSSLN